MVILIQEKTTLKKYEVYIKDIKGINYYIDTEGNVYDTADILHNKVNPRIIAKYNISSNNVYTVDTNN